MRECYVYITASHSHVLYVGMTGDLRRRMYQHRSRLSSFTSRYRVNRLLHFEIVDSRAAAAARERQIKGWVRRRKIALIECGNPTWEDLAAGWFERAR